MLLKNKIWLLRFETQNAIFSSISDQPRFKSRLIKKSRTTRGRLLRAFFGLAFAVLSLFSANAASASPLQLQSNGYQFYTDEWVKFYLDYSQVGFTPARVDFFGDYYDSRTRYDVPIWIDGVLNDEVWYKYESDYEGAGWKAPYVCFYRSYSGPYRPDEDEKCFFLNLSSGATPPPNDAWIQIYDFQTAGQSDLTANDSRLDSTEYEAGETIDFTLRVKNTGTAEAPATTTRIYFEENSRSYTSNKAIGYLKVPDLNPNQTYQGTFSYNLPVDLEAGRYYF